MTISIEIPVFKGQFLQQCIDSVLNQTSDDWHLYLVWDGGDKLSREILERIKSAGHPKIDIYFTPNQGIARARSFLSNQSREAYILPLDDDDELAENAVEAFIRAAKSYPWASLIRAKRCFIDELGEIVEQRQWFPFGPRHYYQGMVTDVFNQAQPYLIRRSAYDRTLGWRGFDDFMQAGEDCDIFLQLEEIAHFELIDEVLYRYRLHGKRASDELTSAAAFEMWRRLADKAVERMGLPLVRTSESPPFRYNSVPYAGKNLDHVEFVVQHNSPVINVLKQAGIEDAVILEASIDTTSRTWRMAGFRMATRALVCFVDNTVDSVNQDGLQALIDAMNEMQADVMGLQNGRNGAAIQRPLLESGLLVVKREVMLATGGFDEQFIPASVQGLDLSLQANRRDFRCFALEHTGIEYRNSGRSLSGTELEHLQNKWCTHEGILEAIKDFSNDDGEGAR